jgi:hypothetical protein
MSLSTWRVKTLALAAAWVLAGLGGRAAPAGAADVSKADGLAAFETVRSVLQHPRCQNCHVPGDAPLQFDEGQPHSQEVVRGPDGTGIAGLNCSACHGEKNPPAGYGENMPPGAPNWHLPPPDTKMVFLGLSGAELCKSIKDTKATGGRDLAAMLLHLKEDKLVLWGWDPGVGRGPVPVPHAQFVAQFQRWVDAGAPCPR